MAADPPRGPWVTIEDQYDRDRYSIGPFPTAEAAVEYCDAINGAQLRMPAGGIPSTIGARTDVGVWNLAWCDGYDIDARLLAMMARPDTIPLDPDGIAAKYGARRESEWRREAHQAIGAKTCWCAALAAGEVPAVEGDVLAAYLALGVEHQRDLFETSPHFGDAGLSRCKVCGGPVLHLMVELESVGDGIHHYYTPLDKHDLAAIEAGTIDGGRCEGWVGGRAGMYRAGFASCLYAGAQVGYIGIDHRLYQPGALPIAED